MDRPRLSPRELAFIIGVPAAWGILLIFHPLGDDEFYPTIDGHAAAWQAVHIGMAVFIPLFAGAVYLLLRGVEGTAATVSRIGLAVFAVFYAAFEITLGIGTGILTEQVNTLPQSQHATGVDVLESYADSGTIVAFTILGSIGLGVAMIGAAVALRGAYALGLAPLALMLLSVPLIAVHEPPFGPIGLAMFILAVILLVRQGKTAAERPQTATPAAQAGTAAAHPG
jgi:hypothetical protein